MDLAIDAQGIGFAYPNGLSTIRDLTLQVGRGRRIGVVGPSGCGKTTLLSILAGLTAPTSGTLNISTLDERRHPLSMVFQQDTLLPWMTLEKNVRLFYRFHKGNKNEIAERSRELIELAGLKGFEGAYPYQLSGGMRRRVALLTGVFPMPEILLLDEPFSALDEPTRVAIHQDVIRIMQRLKMTVILVTHDLAEAATLCDEVFVLTQRPATVYSRHKMDFGEDVDVFKLRQRKEFLDSYAALWEDLSANLPSRSEPTETEAI
jgi:ABC-type nitrate/sulfonate/bicarbonate transport system ATPase subunit